MLLKMKPAIGLIIIIILLVFTESCTKDEIQMQYTTREQAELYAVQLFKERYPKINLDEFIIQSKEDRGNWTVYASRIDKNHRHMRGGGGPYVTFAKTDGHIISIGLQK